MYSLANCLNIWLVCLQITKIGGEDDDGTETEGIIGVQFFAASKNGWCHNELVYTIDERNVVRKIRPPKTESVSGSKTRKTWIFEDLN